MVWNEKHLQCWDTVKWKNGNIMGCIEIYRNTMAMGYVKFNQQLEIYL
jgi:hypothetical protein